MIGLIILDLYGTVIKADQGDGVVRSGLLEFLGHYTGAKKVIFTDGSLEGATSDLRQAGIDAMFDRIYCADDCVGESYYKVKSVELRALATRSRGNIKNLEKACLDFKITTRRAVFIGDNFVGKDEKSAQFNKIRFIKVPQFRQNYMTPLEVHSMGAWVEEDDLQNPFSFASLIGKL